MFISDARTCGGGSSLKDLANVKDNSTMECNDATHGEFAFKEDVLLGGVSAFVSVPLAAA